MRQQSANFKELLAEESRHVTIALYNLSPTPIVVKMSSVELQCPLKGILCVPEGESQGPLSIHPPLYCSYKYLPDTQFQSFI